MHCANSIELAQHQHYGYYCVIEPFECRHEYITRFKTLPARRRRKHHSKKHCVQISRTRVFLISAVNKRVMCVVIPPARVDMCEGACGRENELCA
jgi:hypothetical protein